MLQQPQEQRCSLYVKESVLSTGKPGFNSLSQISTHASVKSLSKRLKPQQSLKLPCMSDADLRKLNYGTMVLA